MNIVFHKRFEKMANKLSPKVKQKMVEQIELFTNDPLSSQLRNHALHTPYKGGYSIDITGDYRAIYVLVDEETALFTHIGTHSQLYRQLNIVHTRDDVVGSVSALADMSIAKGRLNPRDKSLLIVGAAFHDVEQDLGSGAIEEASSATAREAMQSESVFTVEDQDLVDRLIMGTKIHFEDGVMKQTAEREDYLVRLLADADLSSLGRPTDIYWARSVGLFHEFFGESPTKDDQIAFLNNQITPLTHHVYFTEEAVELFPHQADNLSYTEAVFAALNNQTT